MPDLGIKSNQSDTVQTRAAKGGFVSGVSFSLTLLLSVIQVPLLLRFWPQEMYGLWLSVGALSTLLTTLDAGHQIYVGNLLSRQYVEDRIAFRRTLASAVRVAGLTSVVQILLVVAICISGSAQRLVGIVPEHAVDFALAVVIYTVGWISTGSVGAILVRLFAPTGFFVRSAWWSIGMRLAQFCAVVFAACLGWGLVKTTLLFVGAVFVVNVLLFADIRRLYPGLFPWWRGGDLHFGLKNFSRSSVVSFVSVLDLVSLQGVVLMVASGLGAAVVPLFTTIRTLANTAMQGTGFLLNPIQPDLVRYHVQREGKKIGDVFGFFWFATGIVMNGGVVAGLFVVEPLYRIWTQGKLPFNRALFGWLVAAVLVRTLAAPMQTYLTSINHLRALAATGSVRVAVAIGGVLGFQSVWGLSGVGGALFAAELFGSLLLPCLFTYKSLASLGSRLNLSEYKTASLSVAIACMAIAGFALDLFFWPWLAGSAILAVVVVAIAQWRTLTPDVRARALSVTQRRVA